MRDAKAFQNFSLKMDAAGVRRDAKIAARDKKDAEIWAAWEAFDDDDVSTEQLIQLAADTCGVSTERVVSAMTRHPRTTEVSDA